jgi:thiol:disulfide interchange protein
VDIHAGFHTQSHIPGQAGMVPFVAKLMPSPGIVSLDPVYPAGKAHFYPALGALNIYSGNVTIYLPIEVNQSAQAGPIALAGSIHVQTCDDSQCYAPVSIPFSIATQVVPIGQAVHPAHEELFTGFDPSYFAKVLKPATLTPPSTPSPVIAAPAAEASFDIFGVHFVLSKDSWGLALSIAFVVGIIFNLMPCVLPVVPLKIIGFYEVSKHNRGRSVLLSAFFSAGIFAVFAVLAMLVLVVHKIQWGEEYSNPWFVWSLVVVLVIMAGGMFGFFSVPGASARHDRREFFLRHANGGAIDAVHCPHVRRHPCLVGPPADVAQRGDGDGCRGGDGVSVFAAQRISRSGPEISAHRAVGGIAQADDGVWIARRGGVAGGGAACGKC